MTERPLATARRLTALFLLGLAVMVLSPHLAAAAPARASLTDIENDVMCVSCRESLAVAQSPQSYAERNYIRTLIAHGQTKAQIEQALVGQYGPAVLGKPPAHGFNLTVYILPPAILIAGIGTLALLLPKWRRRSKTNAKARTAVPEPSIATADAHRLDEELRRYGG
jgi:cytochrome c-type biogenesis protein CcmH